MKIYENSILRYSSPNEVLGIDDSNCRAVDKSIFESLLSLVPDSLQSQNKYFSQLSKLFAEIVSREIVTTQDLYNVLDADHGTTSVLNFLANRYGIKFPSTYDVHKQRLILKYYPNFIKIKGSTRIERILDFIDRDENEFYQSQLGNYIIEQPYEGLMNIIVDEPNKERIQNQLNFAQTLINRLVPAGMYAKIVV